MKLIVCGIFSLLIPLSLSSCVGFTAEVTLFPEAQNVTSGTMALFTCGGTGKFLTWYFNGTITLDQELADSMMITHEELFDYDQCTVNSSISILGGTLSNNTDIHCLISAGGLNIVHSDTVVLRVQGPPDAVNDIHIIHDGVSGPILSWSAPYSLDGIDTFYYVTITDESNGGESIVKTLSNTSCDNLELSACHNYTFSIIPSNSAGNGSESNLEYFFPGAPISPLHDNITISSLALSSNNRLVTTILKYPITSMCYSHQNITVQASAINDGTVFSTVSQVADSMVTVAIYGLPLNKVLSVSLVLSNAFGTDTVGNGVMLRTYNIQGVALINNHTNGTSCFQCIFLPNSGANGCLLNLIPINSNSNSCSRNRNITLPKTNCSVSEMCLSNIHKGTYNILVYDVYNTSNGTVSYSNQSQMLTDIDIDGVSCSVTPEVTLTIATERTLSPSDTPSPTVRAIGSNAGNIRTAGVLIGIFGGILIIIIVVMLIIFIYRKRQMKGGSLRINQSTTSTDDPNLTRVSTVQSIDISQMPSFSSIEPPPYNPPPQITRDDIDQHPTEQYIIMHSASTRSPSVSNSTSSHLGLVQNGSPSHKDMLITSGHYDHLQQPDEDCPKKHPLDHLLRANNDRYSFELKPFYRNEHLV